MARVDELVSEGLKSLRQKPPDTAIRATKQAYSQKVSEVVAQAFAEELRLRGMDTARPSPPGVVGVSGAERRIMGAGRAVRAALHRPA